ncbi:MAG: PilW family protein [Betaproteobacteria bacterium]|nr:PilW family protein [Betaproteobacteria bacterium]
MAPRSLRTTHLRRNMQGFGIVEIMVGVVIGLLGLLIIYQALALSEGYKRSTTAGNDAQSVGMVSLFRLAEELGNGGNTISDTGAELAVCPNTGSFATTWRPIPVLINDGGDDFTSDSFEVLAGVNRRLVSALDIMVDYAPATNAVVVQSPLGFHPSNAGEAAHRFVIVDIANPALQKCEIATVSPWPAPLNAATGVTTITPVPAFVNTYDQGSAWLINLGPGDRIRKLRYDVVNGVLRSTDLLTVGAQPQPIVSNVALMKVQYGVDTDNDRFIDTWINARNAPWTQAAVLGAPLAQLKQIKAIRVALVVRSAQFERARDAEGRAAVTDVTGDHTVTLFDCRGLLPCTGEMAGVTIPGTGGFRYRTFEQVIPLTNQIWNPT